MLEYTSLLKNQNDLIQFIYPLRGEIASRHQTGRVRPGETNGFRQDSNVKEVISIELNSQNALKNIYSPTHAVDIEKEGDHHATVSYEGTRSVIPENFTLYFSISRDDIGVSLLKFWPKRYKEGFFMLLVSPKSDWTEKEIARKDILFILDTSGSMEGEKIEQAKSSLKSHISQNQQRSPAFVLSNI